MGASKIRGLAPLVLPQKFWVYLISASFGLTGAVLDAAGEHAPAVSSSVVSVVLLPTVAFPVESWLGSIFTPLLRTAAR